MRGSAVPFHLWDYVQYLGTYVAHSNGLHVSGFYIVITPRLVAFPGPPALGPLWSERKDVGLLVGEWAGE